MDEAKFYTAEDIAADSDLNDLVTRLETLRREIPAEAKYVKNAVKAVEGKEYELGARMGEVFGKQAGWTSLGKVVGVGVGALAMLELVMSVKTLLGWLGSKMIENDDDKAEEEEEVPRRLHARAWSV